MNTVIAMQTKYTTSTTIIKQRRSHLREELLIFSKRW